MLHDASGKNGGQAPPGWHSRGYLPHFDAAACIQHVVIHLADSLPAAALRRIEADLPALPEDERGRARRQRIEAWLDAGHGACPLRQDQAAAMMQAVLLHGDGSRYRLYAWVVMPNHVHALCEPLPGWTLARIVTTWKSYSGRRLSTGGGAVWQREYWDRFMRDERHFRTTVAYIHGNPVRADLVDDATRWRWSSAAPQA